MVVNNRDLVKPLLACTQQIILVFVCGMYLPTLHIAHSIIFFVIPSSIGHPPHSSASPVELRLRVGPRTLSRKKKEHR